MAAGASIFRSTMFLKLILLAYSCRMCAAESTVFTEEVNSEANELTENGATISTSGMHRFTAIKDTLFAGNSEQQPSTDASNFDATSSAFDKTTKTIYGPQTASSNYVSPNNVSNIDNQVQKNSSNTSELSSNTTNTTLQPFWSCVKYNMTEQNVIILKNKSSLIWWLDEINKTMSCAVVLFYARWCYFSASLAPVYNAVGRAFSGIPILAIDAYSHNSLNTRYGIVGVPTIILFQESRPVARFNRSRTFKDLVDFIHQSTGMEYNSSVEVSVDDYEEGPLPSKPSEEFNFYLLASVCFLLCLALYVLWRSHYVREYFMSMTLVRTIVRRFEREKND